MVAVAVAVVAVVAVVVVEVVDHLDLVVVVVDHLDLVVVVVDHLDLVVVVVVEVVDHLDLVKEIAFAVVVVVERYHIFQLGFSYRHQLITRLGNICRSSCIHYFLGSRIHLSCKYSCRLGC